MNTSQARESGNPTSKQIETLLNEFDVAQITGMSVASVRRWRLLRQGPRFLKVGSAVRYRSEDISAWLNSHPTGGEQLRARS
jgi:predicted DNA-binding transcriptional regulator AlpA